MINCCSPLGENVPGLPSLRNALALVKETNTIVKESLNSSQFRAQLLAVQRQLTDNPPNITINPKRRFVGQWESKQITFATRTHKNAMVYIFNDILLVAVAKSKGIYKVVEGSHELSWLMILFVEVELTQEITLKEQSTDKKNTTFEMCLVAQKADFQFLMNSPEDKKAVWDAISIPAENFNNKVKGTILVFSQD